MLSMFGINPIFMYCVELIKQFISYLNILKIKIKIKNKSESMCAMLRTREYILYKCYTKSIMFFLSFENRFEYKPIPCSLSLSPFSLFVSHPHSIVVPLLNWNAWKSIGLSFLLNIVTHASDTWWNEKRSIHWWKCGTVETWIYDKQRDYHKKSFLKSEKKKKHNNHNKTILSNAPNYELFRNILVKCCRVVLFI